MASWHVPSASATPWDGADEPSLPPAQRLVMGWQREQYGWLHRPGVAMFGHDRRGVRRWQCAEYRRTFTPATGTIFEDCKLPVSAWVEFLLGIMSFESLAGIARRDRRSPTTPPYQLAKLFLVLDGVQDGVVLSGCVQADEMMCPVPAAEAVRTPSGRRQGGGYSRNNTCIAIACEERDGGSSVFRALGRGKPSGGRAVAAHTSGRASPSCTTWRMPTTRWSGRGAS